MDLEVFLNHLKHLYQVDLTGYRYSTLLRRIGIRMQQVRTKQYQDYLDYMQQQPDEVAHLLDTIRYHFY